MCKARFKRDHLTKNAQAEIKTDCKVYMTVKFDHASLTYKMAIGGKSTMKFMLMSFHF
jgi:hypothetical protein